MADDTLLYMKDTMYEEVIVFRAAEQEFMARQEQKWYKAFVASEAMYIMVLESAMAYSQHVSELNSKVRKPKWYTYQAMLHIHGRALQQFLEIITLMKDGKP